MKPIEDASNLLTEQFLEDEAWIFGNNERQLLKERNKNKFFKPHSNELQWDFIYNFRKFTIIFAVNNFIF